MNITKLHYEMPPLQVSPEEFFSDLIKNSTLERTLYRDYSKEHVLGASQSQQSFQDASLQLDTTSISGDLGSESTISDDTRSMKNAPATTLDDGSIASLQEALSVEADNGGRSA
ncbi:hypothetical protein ANAPC1_01341 [Anaplasma phagocytophilum]|uniref:Uncharacterized protein n=2 Tax=Anaplasma phagocytophilum TaxID=948 RepID=A0AA45UTX2_ANAPH|nr:hypothetical protein ANAPC1_01341 [Anaplasma phagocytophilum]